MAKRPAVAKSELEVAQIVWQLGEASVRQVLEALPPERGLDFKTVQTYLRRLEAKGYLRTRREGLRQDLRSPDPAEAGRARSRRRFAQVAVWW